MEDWDIVTLSETWLTKKYDDSMCHWPNHYCYRQDRLTKKGGGVACYITNDLAPYCSINKNLTVINDKIECLAVNVLKPNNKRMLICTVYRPPSASVSDFCDELQNVGEFSEGETWIAGDYNIDFRKTNSKSFKKINALCRQYGWSPTIKGVTRLNETGGSTIDNILTIRLILIAT